MDAPDPPPTPDPMLTANAQAGANVNTAIGNSILNNANVNGPTGSTRFDVTGSQQITDLYGNKIDVPRYTQTTTLSPEQQHLYDQQVALGGRLNDVAGQALTSASGVLGAPVTQAPHLSTGIGDAGEIRNSLGLQTSVPTTLTPNSFGYAHSSVQEDVGPTNFTADRDAATNAALDRLQPSMNRDDESLAAQLANQGVQQGSAAWNAAMASRAGAKNDLRLGAVQVGDQEQQALFGQALNKGQFHNAAQQQEFDHLYQRAQYRLAADQANNAAQLAAGNFGNAAKSAEGAFANNAQQQRFGQNQAQAEFGNDASLKQFQADSAARDMPLNEISALMHGGQVTMPQFAGYQGGVIAQTPYSDDVYKSAAIDQQNYQTQVQQSQAMMNGLFGLGSKAFGLFGMSDRRLKRNVVRLGRHTNGLALYAWNYVWGGPREVGHMADEVERLYPDAVATHPSGFLMVDYARI